MIRKLVGFYLVFQSASVFSGHSKFVVDALGSKYKKETLTINDICFLIKKYNLHEEHEKLLRRYELELRGLDEPTINDINWFASRLVDFSGNWIQIRTRSNSKFQNIKSIEEELLFENNLKPETLTRIKELEFDGVDIKKYGVKEFCNKLKLCKNLSFVSLENTRLDRLDEGEWTLLGETFRGLKELNLLRIFENNLDEVQESVFIDLIEFFVCSDGFEAQMEIASDELYLKEYKTLQKSLILFPRKI
jgi:hypothetical protein